MRLNANDKGSFRDYIEALYLASAQSALDSGADLADADWITVRNGKATAIDLGKYAAAATRIKAAPAFDKLDLSSGENDEFGTLANEPRHFTEFSLTHTEKDGAIAEDEEIFLLNPMNYIGKAGVKTAAYWRIRHGSVDRDTALPIPAILATKLMNAGYAVDFAVPWGRGHAGDYDLDELFAWIDSICK